MKRIKLWIARDKNGRLFLHEEMPYKNERTWFNSKGRYGKLIGEWFPEITFENSPQKVELKLIKNENAD